MADRAQGYKYQLGVTAYLASILSKDETVQNYHIFYEVKELEPFDDIVLAVQYDSEDFRLYLVQVKSGKVKLDVNNYLEEYTQIKQNKRWKCLANVSKISEVGIQFWYFASQRFRPQPIPFQEGRQLEIRKRTLNADKVIIKQNVYELCSTDEGIARKYQDFFRDFYVFLEQIDTNTITIRLKGMWALNDATQVIEYLDKYFTKNKSESLNKTDFEHELLRIRLWDSIVNPTKISSYKRQSAIAWNDFTLLYNVTIVKNELDIETCLFGCILQSLDDKITIQQWNDFVDNEGKLDKKVKDEFTTKSGKPETLKDLLVYMWKCDRIPLVLKSNNSLPQLKDFLNLKQHYIIIDSDPDRRYNEVQSYNLSVIKNLEDIKVEPLLQSVLVSIQGRRPASLYTVINGNQALMQTLTCADILKLMEPRQVYMSKDCLEAHNYMLFIIEVEQSEMSNYEKYDPNGDSISIYCPLNESSEVYKTMAHNPAFKNYSIYRLRLENDKLKLIGTFDINKSDKDQGLKVFQIDQYGKSVYRMNEHHAIPIIGKVTKINSLTYLHRYMRKGSVDNTQPDVDEISNLTMIFSETIFSDKDFFKEMNTKMCMITGEAGVGKTTFLQVLTQICPPQCYVLFCNLAQFQVEIRKTSQQLVKDPLNFLWSKQEPLLYDNFLNVLRKERKRLILILDSFDEIVPTCKEQVLEIIRKLNEDDCLEKIIIGSRLLTVHFLSNQFTISIAKIEEFSNEYNNHYLENWNLHEAKLQKMPTEFVKNPLYLDMLRSISQNFDIDLQTLSRWSLYNRIVDLEIERYSRRINHNIDDIEKNHILKFHWGLAFKLIFGNNPVTQKFAQEDQMRFTNAARLGMIKCYDENQDPVFVHHTFAEFFATQWLVQTTDKEDAKFIYKSMLRIEHRYVLDIYSEQFPLHKAVLNADDRDVEILEQIEMLCRDKKEALLQTDDIGRTALHVIGSRYRHNTDRCLETIIRYMREEVYDLYSRDKLLNWTWIDYCENSEKSYITKVSPKLYAMHETYWSYYASSLSSTRFDFTTVYNAYNMAIDHFSPNVLPDLLFVSCSEENFLRFRNLCLNSKCVIAKLPKYFELNQFDHKPLHLAVIYSNINVVRSCIERGDNVNVADFFGCTPLYYSVLTQNSEIVQLLLQNGGDKWTRREDTGFTTFQLSLFLKNKDIAKMLITGTDFKKFGSIWLLDAIRCGDIEISALLLEAGIDPNTRRSNHKLESFDDEIQYRDVVKALKQYSVYNYDISTIPLDETLSIVNALQKVTSYIPNNYLPLNTAIHARRNDIVQLLLEKGININEEIRCDDDAHSWEREFNVSTPLCCAISSWNADMVELLLKHSANVNYVDRNGLTALKIAIREEVLMYNYGGSIIGVRWKKFRERLYNEYFIDISLVIERLDWSLIKLGHLDRRLQIIDILLRHGADVNFEDNDDLTPLEEALETRNWRIIEMILLNKRNSIDLKQLDFGSILAAIPTENVEIIEILLKNGANPNSKTASGVTPLYVAARRRHAGMVKLLFEHGASADIITSTHTLLDRARWKGEINVVTLLLELGDRCFVGPIYDIAYPAEVLNLLRTVEKQANINFVKEIDRIYGSNNTYLINKILQRAADLKNPNGMKYLNAVLELNKYGIDQSLLRRVLYQREYKSNKFDYVLYAAMYRNKTMIEILARNAQGVNKVNKHGRTALVSVIKSSIDKSVVKFLLENRADINVADKYGDTPLIMAIQRENIGFIEILLEHKVRTKYEDKNGLTPLIFAINKNAAEIIRILLNNGVDVNFACKSGLTAIYTAVMKGNIKVINILLNYGAKSAIETCGNTLLFNAINSGHKKIVHLLVSEIYFSDDLPGDNQLIKRILRNLANVNTVYEFGLTPLHLASKRGHSEIVTTLLNFNADSNQLDEHGRTPLHYAAEIRNMETIQQLVISLVGINIKDNYGLTAADYAYRNGHYDIVKLLKYLQGEYKCCKCM